MQKVDQAQEEYDAAFAAYMAALDRHDLNYRSKEQWVEVIEAENRVTVARLKLRQAKSEAKVYG